MLYVNEREMFSIIYLCELLLVSLLSLLKDRSNSVILEKKLHIEEDGSESIKTKQKNSLSNIIQFNLFRNSS